MSKAFSAALEYLYVGYTYVKGPFAWAVGFVRSNPKTSLALFVASHAVRWL